MKKRILNVGCGTDVFGTDFIDKYPQRRDVKKCDIDRDRIPYHDNTFNEVYCGNLFEHLTNPGFAINEMHRVLKKNGELVLITDNANFWEYSTGSIHLGGYESKVSKFRREDRHYQLFTDWHLKNYARKSGFRNVRIRYIYYNSSFSISMKILVWIIKNLLDHTRLWRIGYFRLEMTAQK